MATYVENPDYYKTINLKDCQDWIKHYNQLPISKRTSWLDLQADIIVHQWMPFDYMYLHNLKQLKFSKKNYYR